MKLAVLYFGRQAAPFSIGLVRREIAIGMAWKTRPMQVE